MLVQRGFAVSLIRSDLLAATPYVDQVLYSSFDVHVLAGSAVLGGSIRDEEVIEAANERGLAMVFTGIRHFKH